MGERRAAAEQCGRAQQQRERPTGGEAGAAAPGAGIRPARGLRRGSARRASRARRHGRWAAGPLGRWAAGPLGRWAAGPLGRWAAGPLGRWAAGPLGRWAAGPLGRWAAGPLGRWAAGPLGRWAAGPLGRWAAGPLGRWAAGPLGRWAAGPLGRWAAGPLGRWAAGPLGRWAAGPLAIIRDRHRGWCQAASHKPGRSAGSAGRRRLRSDVPFPVRSGGRPASRHSHHRNPSSNSRDYPDPHLFPGALSGPMRHSSARRPHPGPAWPRRAGHHRTMPRSAVERIHHPCNLRSLYRRYQSLWDKHSICFISHPGAHFDVGGKTRCGCRPCARRAQAATPMGVAPGRYGKLRMC